MNPILIGSARSDIKLENGSQEYPISLSVEGDARFYVWSFGDGQSTYAGRVNDSVQLTYEQAEKFVYQLRNASEELDHFFDITEFRASEHGNGKKPMQLMDLQGGWGKYGLSVFTNGNGRRFVHVKYDSGTGMDERRVYETMASLDADRAEQLADQLNENSRR
ncbi:MAG: hypothetical protein HZB67_03605 [Candidatus Aenigmarchaeota archaeon]|nr:hypothetical protein [Candidatus Aenigmarchaeota archaeon]